MAEEATEKAAPSKGRRSRREVLAGAAGALGVIAAQTVGRATPAQAGVVYVQLGVEGQQASGTTGVTTTAAFGLHGRSTSQESYGVYGEGGTGVFGFGTTGDGVFGQASDVGTSGVHGVNEGTGYGVTGGANVGVGVWAYSEDGTALKVTGKSEFSRSGKATIQAGNSQVLVQGVALTSASLVLATLQKFQAGISVAAVVPNVANSRFTIRLNKAPTANLKVAWFIVN